MYAEPYPVRTVRLNVKKRVKKIREVLRGLMEVACDDAEVKKEGDEMTIECWLDRVIERYSDGEAYVIRRRLIKVTLREEREDY